MNVENHPLVKTEPSIEYKTTRKKVDLDGFMNALRRYIDVIIDYRLYGEKSCNVEEHFKGKVYEAARELEGVIKPLFEEF